MVLDPVDEAWGFQVLTIASIVAGALLSLCFLSVCPQLTPGLGAFQSCTETLHQFSGRPNGVRAFTFNRSKVEGVCLRVFGVVPDTEWTDLHYGGFAIADGLSTASNIIFSSGLLDPWHGGGFLKQWSPSCPVLVMPNGAHHLDLRAPHPQDPPDVTAVREAEERIIRGWIDGFVEADMAGQIIGRADL
jgi:lysosomal Pro-X carboxypeptidase